MDVTTKIITQFVKDLSFENPKGPSGFQSKDEKPTINAKVDVKAANRQNTNIYEVELNISVSAARVEEQIYIVDLKYVAELLSIINLAILLSESCGENLPHPLNCQSIPPSFF